MTLKVCFIGGARYADPLDATNEKKFRVLKALGELFVIGFSHDYRLRRFNQHAHFYLLAQLPLPILRYVEMFVGGVLVASWLIFRHGVQVLVAQSPYEGFVGAMAKKIAGWFGHRIALVVESHGDFEESLFLQRAISLHGLYRSAMLYTARFAFKHADAVRVISDSTKEQVERWAPGIRIVQFPTWTDIDVFLKAGLEKSSADGQEILYTGVLIPRKGVHHLISAVGCIAKDFSQAHLVILGNESDAVYVAELKALVTRLELDARVRFIGAMPQTELAVWMARASVFVLPSVSEGLGRVVVEAMATGTPAIGSHVGGIPEMVHDGATGFLVPPGDEAALAQRIRWVLEHPEETRQMGRRARRFAEQFFSTRSYVAGYREIFDDCSTVVWEREKHAPSTL